MTLPSGIFELIMEMLPLPRVWQWSLLRLKRRCKLAPHQAVQDLSTIMDEIIRDSAIFSGPDQSNLLMKINRSPQVLFTCGDFYILFDEKKHILTVTEVFIELTAHFYS